MAYGPSKTSLMQTSTNAAATLAAAGIEDLTVFQGLREALYADLLAVMEQEVTEAPPAQPKPMYGGKGDRFPDDKRGGDFVVFFGQKHKGKTVRDIFSEDPSYVTNFLTKSTIGKAKTAAEEFLESL